MNNNEKIRPLPERIARLAGCTAFKDFRDGFGGGSPVLVDADVAGALALCRKRVKDAQCDVGDIGPEVLITYYGSSQEYRRHLVNAYLNASKRDNDPMHRRIVQRMAATLAVQQVSGVEYARSQQAEYAYILCTRLVSLRDEVKRAYDWYMERIDESLPEFIAILRAIIQKRLNRFLSDRAEREEHLAIKRKLRQEAKKASETPQ